MASSSHSASGLRGHLLIATPSIEDPRFDRSVVYVCTHSADAAMGLVINKPYGDLRLRDLLSQLDIEESDNARDQPVLFGGPLDSDRGFVLHSDDYDAGDSTMAIADGIGLTATKDVLEAMTTTGPPSRAVLALGYAGWGAGQLEHEVQNNAWLTCLANADLVFDGDLEAKWSSALMSMGVSPAKLSSLSGEA